MLHRSTSHSPAIGPGCAGPSLAIPCSAIVDRVPLNSTLEPLAGGASFAVDPSACDVAGNKKHTQNPIVTGTSVLGFVYKDGILIACDTLGSYGSTKRYKSLQRIIKVNDHVVLAAAGEISDFQYIQRLLEELANEDFCEDDGVNLSAPEVHAYLTRVMYNRRNKFDPLWNSLVIAGLVEGSPYLATVGMIGTSYADSNIATGFGQHLARPLFRDVDASSLDEAAAVELMHKALKVCYYRDKQSINKFNIARITKEGIHISEPFALETNWEYKRFVNPAASAVGTW